MVVPPLIRLESTAACRANAFPIRGSGALLVASLVLLSRKLLEMVQIQGSAFFLYLTKNIIFHHFNDYHKKDTNR